MYNRELKQFNDPFTMPNDAHALYNIRLVMNQAKEKGDLEKIHAKDLEMYCLADFDNVSGKIKPLTRPKVICSDLLTMLESEV